MQDVTAALDLDPSCPTSPEVASSSLSSAVLSSFRQAGVTMVDHHAQSEQFMEFFRREHRERGGCPADWVWISPPVGGSLTEVFHQEMLNYVLKPCYNYQVREAFVTIILGCLGLLHSATSAPAVVPVFVAAFVNNVVATLIVAAAALQLQFWFGVANSNRFLIFSLVFIPEIRLFS